VALVEVTLIGDRELAAKFGSLGESLRNELRPTIKALQWQLVGTIQQLISGEVLKNRTNKLRDSIVAGSIQETDASIAGVVGTNTVYARIQELGGTITPKNAKSLTIPLDAVLTANGVARYTAREVIADPTIAGFARVFTRNGVIFGSTGKGADAEWTPLFVLKQSVTIPPHEFMARALASLHDTIQSEMKEAMARAVENATG
jgi:phage gpG-like protein